MSEKDKRAGTAVFGSPEMVLEVERNVTSVSEDAPSSQPRQEETAATQVFDTPGDVHTPSLPGGDVPPGAWQPRPVAATAGSRAPSVPDEPPQQASASEDSSRANQAPQGDSSSEVGRSPSPALEEGSTGQPQATAHAPAAAEVPRFVQEEIAKYTQEAIGKYGLQGTVTADAGGVVLSGAGPKGRVHYGNWTQNWPLMSEEMRVDQAGELARAFARTRRPHSSAPPPKSRLKDPVLLGGLGTFLALVTLFFLYRSTLSPSDAPPENRGEPIAKEQATTGASTHEARELRACHATRARVHRGATVSVADVDGWVVELALLKRGGTHPLDTHPALESFVEEPQAGEGSRFIWNGVDQLASVNDADSVVKVKRYELVTDDQKTPGVRLIFNSTLVDSYFDADRRSAYFKLATALSDQLEATHAGLYARCADQKDHVIGSWFRGSDTPSAAASLLFFMGLYATPKHISPPFFRQPGDTDADPSLALGNIIEGTKNLDRASLSTVLGTVDGMAQGKDGSNVVITFPFRDANRASRASRTLARVTSLGR